MEENKILIPCVCNAGRCIYRSMIRSGRLYGWTSWCPFIPDGNAYRFQYQPAMGSSCCSLGRCEGQCTLLTIGQMQEGYRLILPSCDGRQCLLSAVPARRWAAAAAASAGVRASLKAHISPVAKGRSGFTWSMFMSVGSTGLPSCPVLSRSIKSYPSAQIAQSLRHRSVDLT